MKIVIPSKISLQTVILTTDEIMCTIFRISCYMNNIVKNKVGKGLQQVYERFFSQKVIGFLLSLSTQKKQSNLGYILSLE
jgi:hypothetical protein